MSAAASSSSAPPSAMNPPPARPRLPKHPTQQDIDNARDTSVLRLKASWEAIWAKYEAMGDNDDDDVIDLESETIIVDKGNVRNGPVRVFGSALSDVIGEEEETQEQEQSGNLSGKTTTLCRKALSAARGSGRVSEHDTALQPWSSNDFDSLLASPSLADPRPRRYDLIKSFRTIAKHLAPATDNDDDVDPLTSFLPDIPATPTRVLRDPRSVRPVELHHAARGDVIHEPEVKPEDLSEDTKVLIKPEPTDATDDSVPIKSETVDDPSAPAHAPATEAVRIKDEPTDDPPIKQEPLENFTRPRSPTPVLPTSSTPLLPSSLHTSLSRSSSSSSPSSSPTTATHASYHTPTPSSPLKRKSRSDDRAPTPPLPAASTSSLTGSGRHHPKRVAAPALGVDAGMEVARGGRARWKEGMRPRRRDQQAGEDGEMGSEAPREERGLEMAPTAEDGPGLAKCSTLRGAGANPTPTPLKAISALRIRSSPTAAPPAPESEQGHDPAQAALDALFGDGEDELVGAAADQSGAHKLEREKSQEKGIARKAPALAGTRAGPRRREWKWLKDLYGGEVAEGDDPLVG